MAARLVGKPRKTQLAAASSHPQGDLLPALVERLERERDKEEEDLWA
jgi:hypothetical protein